ncbi:MAG: hypothetical protein JW957_00070 [Candidatus Omnitrophica bacterium]|nr:hypothetical protein [Candidatus Omnitrophota bacterium]
MSSYKEICGCIHIHFPLKRIEETFEPLGREGNKANLDFLVINSHTPKNNPSRYEKLFKKEGYYGKTLVIKGEETDDRRKQNHLLVIGGTRWYGNRKESFQVLSEIKKEGCVSFVAHPEGVHKLFLLKKEYHWEDWETDGFTGIEIWSMLFDWARRTRVYNLPVRYFGFPHNLQGPNPKTLSVWDALSLKKKVVGMAGLDIHALPFFFSLIDVKRNFRYAKIFAALRNHLLLKEPLNGNPQEDKKKILNALRKGNLFFANDLIGDSCGFYFGSEGEKFVMGDAVSADTALTVKLPLKAELKILHNGHVVHHEETEVKQFRAEKEGVYRVEARLKGKPWIFSNHIRVEKLQNSLFD